MNMFSCIRGKERTFRNLVNGEWLSSESGKFIEIYSPIGENCLVGKVPAMTKEEVDQSIKSAKIAQNEWRNVPVSKRADILYKAADILVEKLDDIADIMMREIGKDRKSSESEILRSADYIRFTADTAKTYQEKVFQEIVFQDLKEIKYQ